MKRLIAIDGPAGAGKSTLARKLAEKLGFLYIDTGAMYRAVTYGLLINQVNLLDSNSLTKTLTDLRFDLVVAYGSLRVLLDGQVIDEKIRSQPVDERVSEVARLSEVRDYLREKQQELARSQPSVTEGRDIGTVILPDADLKIFLTASPEVRARRRWLQHQELGIAVDMDEVKHNIATRDLIDSTRANAPLRAAHDARVVDTSTLTIDQVLDVLFGMVTGEDGSCKL